MKPCVLMIQEKEVSYGDEFLEVEPPFIGVVLLCNEKLMIPNPTTPVVVLLFVLTYQLRKVSLFTWNWKM